MNLKTKTIVPYYAHIPMLGFYSFIILCGVVGSDFYFLIIELDLCIETVGMNNAIYIMIEGTVRIFFP